MILTADVDGAVEGLGDLRVHLDQELLLRCQLLVAGGDLVLHPGIEWLADD